MTLEMFIILFVLQMTISCMINTYFCVVPPKSLFGIMKLSTLPFSIYNVVEMNTYRESELLDDFML
jgi:nitric oxide reductase large subunit